MRTFEHVNRKILEGFSLFQQVAFWATVTTCVDRDLGLRHSVTFPRIVSCAGLLSPPAGQVNRGWLSVGNLIGACSTKPVRNRKHTNHILNRTTSLFGNPLEFSIASTVQCLHEFTSLFYPFHAWDLTLRLKYVTNCNEHFHLDRSR